MKGLAATSLDEGFTSESSKSFLSFLARLEITINFMNADVPIKSSKGEGKSKKIPRVNKVVWRSAPLSNSPRIRVLDQKFHCTAQQYWEDLMHKKMILPDFTGRNKFRYTYNTDRIQSLRSGKAREPPPKGQNPTAPGVLDIQSILKTHRHCRSPRDYYVPEFFNPYYQYSHAGLVK